MKVLSGILLLVAYLIPALGVDVPITSGECNYICPVVGVFPVCGTDGNTYPSRCYVECIARKQAGSGRVSVSVKAPGRCPEKPCICTAIADPVCGTNGRTYPNPCSLRCDSRRQQRYGFPPINIRSKGPCPDEGCFCPAVVKPVCGTDVRTYGNACELGCESKRQQRLGRPPIFVASYGVCPRSLCNCPLFISPVCGTDGRSYRNVCFLECSSRINQGQGLPPVFIRHYNICKKERCMCPADINPVCASDGNTYNNVCALRCQNGVRFAVGQPPLTILYRGPCKGCACPKIWDPVCGSDGKTYGNPCLIKCENKRRKHLGWPPLTYTKGECGCFCPEVYQPVCASDFKTYGNLCKLGCENQRRVHAGLPALHVISQGECGCNCPNVNQPVCGSDKRTYKNVCRFNCHNFYLIRNGYPALSIIKTGPC